MNTKDIGATIGKLRKEKGMTQKELAEQLYVSTSTVSKWETKGVVPDMFMLENLTTILGVSLEELVKNDCEKKVFGEDSITEIRVEELQPSKKMFHFKNKIGMMLAALLVVVICIAGGYIHKSKFDGPTFEVVDEFYDDTSKHWGYETLYHVVVEFEGEVDSEDIREQAVIYREKYEHWFDKVVTIKISYFDEYTERNQVYNTDCHTFLFPRDR